MPFFVLIKQAAGDYNSLGEEHLEHSQGIMVESREEGHHCSSARRISQHEDYRQRGTPGIPSSPTSQLRYPSADSSPPNKIVQESGQPPRSVD